MLNIALPRVLFLAIVWVVFAACGFSALHTQPCLPTCGSGQTCVSGRCVNAGGGDGGSPMGCQADSDCKAGRCLLTPGAAGTCVACLSEADCPVGTCNPSHACVALPDGCGSAETLDLSQGPVHLEGSTVKAGDDTHVSCAVSPQGNDLVYRLVVPQQGRLVATAVTDGSFRPALELRSDCSSGNSALQCTRASVSQPTTSKLQIDPLPAGTYFLWLDSDDGAAGGFTLDVALENPPPADSCSAPSFIELGDSPVTLSGSTVGLKDDEAGSCGGAGAPDAVFAVHLSSARQVKLDLTTPTAGFSPVLLVRQACDDASASTQVACVAGSPGSFDLPVFGPGVFYVIVDGLGDNRLVTAGSFTLTLTPSAAAPAPTNDTCGLAQTLALPPTGSGTVSVQSDTTAAHNDSVGCFGNADDLVYQFHLGEPRMVQVTVTPLFGSGYRPVVYLRPAGACASESATDQIGCTLAVGFGEPVTTVVPNLPAGDWFLWVDGYYTDGPFSLRVDTGPPPAPPSNDSCTMPGTVNVASGYGSVSGTTLGAADDVNDPRCTAPAGVASPDVVYGLSLAQPVFLGLDLKAAPGSSLEPVVELRGGPSYPACTDANPSSSLLGCNWGDPAVPNRAVYTAPSVGPGDYWIWVEGDQASQGDFSLRVVTEPVPTVPATDTCQALATPLESGSVGTGDTRGARADALDPCLDGEAADFGRDVVYPLSVASTSTVTVTVTPDPTSGTLLRPVVALRSACSDASTTRSCAAASDYGTAASFTFTNLTPGNYYLWVGGVRESSGVFTLQVQ